MKIQRTKNAARNVLFDGILRVFILVVPFLMRSVMLHYLGVEYLGLSGLFRSILTILNLTEMGVGSAMVFSMYRPIAEDDRETICALMNLYRIIYRIIGLVILVIGLALTPFLSSLVSGDVPPDLNLYILYYMNLGSTVLSYWLFAYKGSLLYAHQRNDVKSRVTLALQVLEYGMKVAALVLFRSYYLYLIIQLFCQIALNVIIALKVNRLFPDYLPQGRLPKEKILDIARRVRDLFTSKFSAVVTDSADTLVISSFLGLKSLAVYQNYYYIYKSLRGFLEVMVDACIAGIGNSLITESGEKNYADLCKLTMLFGFLLNASSAMLLCMYQPFMEVWMGQENLLEFSYVICFVIYYYTVGMNKLVNMYKDAAGIWRKDRWRPLTAALVNLGLNLSTVNWLGLYGVLLSTVISIVAVQVPWLFHNLFGEVFPRKYIWHYTRQFCGYAAVAAAGCAASWFICSKITLPCLPAFFIYGAVAFVVSNLIFLPVYGRNNLFIENLARIKHVIFKR